MISYATTAERPALDLWILDKDGTLIDLSSGYTFTVKIGGPGSTALLTKTSGITGAAGSGVEPTGTPNLVIAWTTGELAITPGAYTLQVTATDGSSLDRHYSRPIEITKVVT